MICKICNYEFKGRSDKQFCSVKCKNQYHTTLRKNTQKATLKIDAILHRNRSILFELMQGKTSEQIMLRLVLEQKQFNFKYHTHANTNSKGKTYYWVYDFAWMSFSNDKILVVKPNK